MGKGEKERKGERGEKTEEIRKENLESCYKNCKKLNYIFKPESTMGKKVRDREHHERLFKASLNPLRRKIVACIGVQGKSREEVKKELNLSDFQLKFNIDYLIQQGFVVEEEGKLKLTDDGIELLEVS